jgi:hypothetical protein
MPDDMITHTALVKASKHRWRKQHDRSGSPATCIKCGLLRTRPHSGYFRRSEVALHGRAMPDGRRPRAW